MTGPRETKESVDSRHNGSGVRGRAIVLHPEIARRSGRRAPEARLVEAVGLTAAIDLEVSESAVVPVSRARPATLIGGGAVEEWAERVAALEPEVVVVDAPLTPIQQRNLERAWRCKAIDRTGLILEIFGERARTKEGQLQVELAHLTFQRSRLVRSWTHLERQRGGAGFLGGPGESQIELDRRLIDDRIVAIRRELDQVIRTRGLQRQARKRVPFPTVALVGYTNAGKSTLFNRLTQASVLSRDQLFATLDPTMRAVELPSGRRVILSDTVGFISDLPTDLVAAFRATLEEVVAADIVVHVRDLSHPDSGAQRADVLEVLGGLGVSADEGAGPPVIEALNKIDQASGPDRAAAAGCGDGVPVSALTGENCEALLMRLDARIAAGLETVSLSLELRDGATMAWLYRHSEVLERHDGELTSRMRVRIDPADLARLRKSHPELSVEAVS